jgi:hypothetical protein
MYMEADVLGELSTHRVRRNGANQTRASRRPVKPGHACDDNRRMIHHDLKVMCSVSDIHNNVMLKRLMGRDVDELGTRHFLLQAPWLHEWREEMDGNVRERSEMQSRVFGDFHSIYNRSSRGSEIRQGANQG